jgi:hypothetical protein
MKWTISVAIISAVATAGATYFFMLFTGPVDDCLDSGGRWIDAELRCDWAHPG